jgi:hypothetical protein
LDAHILASKSNTGLEGKVGFRFVKAGGVWVELDYLPATPNEVKAQVTKAKADKHRITAPPTVPEVRRDLNLTRSSDADTERRRVLLAAIGRCGNAGMERAAMRLLPGLHRGSDLNRALEDLEGAGQVEPCDDDRFRLITGEKP